MTDYSPKAVTADGVAPTANTAASGDKLLDAGDRRWLRVINGGGSSITVTITPPGLTGYGEANPDKVITVPNGASRSFLVPAAYADPSDSYKVALAWSATTSVTFEYWRL
jgi:hypothetical protein